MGFSIDYGAPGGFMAVMIVLGGAGLCIVVYFLLSAARGAHEAIEDEDTPPD